MLVFPASNCSFKRMLIEGLFNFEFYSGRGNLTTSPQIFSLYLSFSLDSYYNDCILLSQLVRIALSPLEIRKYCY